MSKKTSFIKFIQLWVIIIIVMIGGSMVALDIVSAYRDFNFRADQMRSDYTSRQKQIIKQEVKRVVDKIRQEKAQSEMLTKKEIKSRTYEAYAIAQNIYDKNKTTKTRAEIQQMIVDALRPIRFAQKSGYYFITRFDGIHVLFADKPELKGKNLLDVQDTHGQYIVKDLIKIARQSGEGFYEYHWTKPHTTGNDFKKISFIKRFEPYDWFIGTGLYIDDVESQIKADLLSDISRIRFGKEGYIFVDRLNGDALVSNGKLITGTKKLWEVFNKNPEKIKDVFKKECNAALKSEGDYIYYSLIKLTKPTKESPKVSFIYGIPELQWLVGAGVYLDDVETVIARMRTELTNQIKATMLYYILITLGIVAFFLLLFSRLNRRLKKDFNLFISFFNRAALSDEPIDRDRVRFYELDRMAENANRMIEDRKQAEKELKESEEKYRLIFTNSSDVIYSLDPEFKILTVSPSVKKMMGYAPEELIGRPFQDLNILAPDYLEQAFSDSARVLSGENITSKTYEFIAKDGSKKFGEVSSAPLYRDNKIVATISVARDITEHRQAEAALRESEEKYRLLIKNQTDLVVKVDLEGKFQFVSPSHCKMFGKTENELLGNNFMPLVHEDDRESTAKAMEALYEPPYKAYIEQRVMTADGWKWIAWMDTAVLDENKNVIAVIGLGRDITEVKQTGEALKESEEKYRLLAENITETIWVMDINTLQFSYVSPSIKTTGFSADEIASRQLNDLLTPASMEVAANAISEELTTDNTGQAKPRTLELEFYHKDGSTVWTELSARFIRDTKGRPYSIMGVARDISKRRRMEQVLRENEFKFRILFDFSPQAIALTEKKTGKLMDVNRKFCELTQYDRSELLGKTTTEMGFYSQTDRNRFTAELKAHGEISGLEMDFRAKDDSILTALMFCQPIVLEDEPYLLTIFIDITTQKSLEEQLRQAQKMESIGTLSGGIAHDFNNILSIIIGNTELALDDVPEWNVAHENLEEIKAAGLRAKNIVSQLLAFSRKSDQDLKPVAIVPVIKDAIQFLRSTIPTSIDICADIVDAGETVLADPVQLNQVMMNLCINASQAIEQTETGGILTVNVESVILDNTSASIYPDLTPGDYVKITVSDTGPGIDPDILDRIFDPYFTTKDVGKGSGMGLAVVHGIVKNHNGSIAVESAPGKGAVFSILLPKIAQQPEVKVETPMDLPTGNETILFVDDEPSIMKLGQRMIETLGYTVDATMSPTDALKRFRSTPDKYDLVITDMTMPEMTGAALAEELMSIRGDIPVIICTGHSALIDEEKAKTMDIAAFVMKPMTRQKIARIIRQILEEMKSE